MMLEEIATLIGGSPYIGNMPDLPNNAVCIYPTSGFNADLAGELIREPTFQVKVRNTSYATGYTLAETIQITLHGINANGNFLLIEQQGDIMDMGRDESNRQEFTINFRCYYRG